MPATKSRTLSTTSWVGRIPQLKPGQYADGLPLDEVHYLCCKLILRPHHFTSRKSLFKFADVMQGPAREHDVYLSTKGYDQEPLKIREVIFADTPDFRLYNNSFILRRRISYVDGFPAGDPEIVFKFRHPDEQKAAAVDVRPHISGKYRIKFKAEAMPLKDQIGGYRLLYSHNCQFGLSQVHEGDRLVMSTLARVFPALSALKKSG